MMIYDVKIYKRDGTLKKVIPSSQLFYKYERGFSMNLRAPKYIEIVCEVCGVMLKVRNESQDTCQKKACKNRREIKMAGIIQRGRVKG